MEELYNLISTGVNLIEHPDANIISARKGVVNFFSKLHGIAAGGWPEGLRQKVYTPSTSADIVTETNAETGFQECTGYRILQKMLMIAEALYNTDIYDRLKSSIDRLEKWKYMPSSDKFIPSDCSDYNNALDELWALILKMTNLIYKPRFFGHFIGVKLKL